MCRASTQTLCRMRASHHPDYYIPLPEGHPFPMPKYRLVFQYLIARALIDERALMLPGEASLVDIGRVHAADYIDKLVRGTLSAAEVRRLGVPWSARLWRRSRLAVQGTLEAARAALADGLAANLAGGTHHAFPDHAEGFCILNDVAIAIRVLQAEGRIGRAVVVDLDVHQGNGTAAIFAEDADVFTFSMHGATNYPAMKQRSSLDIGLPDGSDDDTYLGALREALPRVLHAARADIAFYLAGVDVVSGDRYGRLALSESGLRERERYVLETLAAARVPTVITLAGGYAPTRERTSELHTIVFEEAQRIERQE